MEEGSKAACDPYRFPSNIIEDGEGTWLRECSVGICAAGDYFASSSWLLRRRGESGIAGIVEVDCVVCSDC